MSSRTIFRLLEETAERYGDAPAPTYSETVTKNRTLLEQYRLPSIACGLRVLGNRQRHIVSPEPETVGVLLADVGVMAKDR
jgi:hypothetical protein